MGKELKVKGEELKAKGEEMKAKDEEPAPKQRGILEALILREEIRAPSYWDRLPYHVTVQVYSYLKNSDRSAMARVCQAWHQSFKDPSLWRSREFTVGGPHATHTGRNDIRFASMFGSSLRDVVIHCIHRKTKTYKHITATVEKLLGKLENARLCRLELLDLYLEEFLQFPDGKNTVCGCLVKLLKTQTALKHVVFMDCQFDTLIETELLNVLSESSGQTLESLHMNNNYQRFLDVFEANTNLDVMAKFTNLREISVNYRHISDEMLQLWTVHLKGKLQLLKIKVWPTEYHDHVISSRIWENLSTACPQLKVDFSIYHTSNYIPILPFLTPGMPLTGFYMKSYFLLSAHDSQLAAALIHLADNFDKKLESLTLLLKELEDTVDNEIILIVEKCRVLTSMCVPASTALGNPTAICNAFRERQVRNVRLHIGRFHDSQPFRDIVRTFQDMLNNIPNLTVELVDDE